MTIAARCGVDLTWREKSSHISQLSRLVAHAKLRLGWNVLVELLIHSVLLILSITSVVGLSEFRAFITQPSNTTSPVGHSPSFFLAVLAAHHTPHAAATEAAEHAQ